MDPETAVVDHPAAELLSSSLSVVRVVPGRGPDGCEGSVVRRFDLDGGLADEPRVRALVVVPPDPLRGC